MKRIMVGQVTIAPEAVARLRSDEVLVFDWVHIAVCCAAAAEVSPPAVPLGVSPARQRMCRRPAIFRAGRTPTGPRIPTWPRAAHWSESSQRVRKFTPCLPDDFGLRSILGQADDVSDHASPLLTRTGGTR
ncbi:MAG TPA: hypothetical protein VFI46_12595 [Jiangellaceae bacterium]|nr:hypothetical protein [Jiangellaceae bacterium]